MHPRRRTWDTSEPGQKRENGLRNACAKRNEFENLSKSHFLYNTYIEFWICQSSAIFNSWLIPKLASLSNFVKCDVWGEFSHTVSQDTFISKVFWLDLTWTEAANGDARDVYVTLPSLTKSLLLLKKKRDTTTVQILFKTATEKYHFLLPGNYNINLKRDLKGFKCMTVS